LKKKIENKQEIFINLENVKKMLIAELTNTGALKADGVSSRPGLKTSVETEVVLEYDSHEQADVKGFNVIIIEKGEVDE